MYCELLHVTLHKSGEVKILYLISVWLLPLFNAGLKLDKPMIELCRMLYLYNRYDCI